MPPRMSTHSENDDGDVVISICEKNKMMENLMENQCLVYQTSLVVLTESQPRKPLLLMSAKYSIAGILSQAEGSNGIVFTLIVFPTYLRPNYQGSRFTRR
jgi:hypothetical protein